VQAREGDLIEVESGAYRGQRGVVGKVTGTGAETRFRVILDQGRTTWVEDVSPQSLAAPIGSHSLPAAPEELAQGQGKAGGKGGGKGGQGKGPSFAQVEIDPAAATRQVHLTQVPPAADTLPSGATEEPSKGKGKKGPAQGKGAAGGKGGPAGKAPPKDLDVGAFVEVTSGDYAGSRGHVVKVICEKKDIRWRVKLEDDGPMTWVDGVMASPQEQAGHGDAASRPAAIEAHAKPKSRAEREAEHKANRAAHFSALRPADIHNVQWAKKRDIERCKGGSGGVTLVDLGDECVVLKWQGESVIAEVLAERVATAAGIRVARCRMLNCMDVEFEELVQAELACNPGVFQVLEYVPGHILMGVEAQLALASPQDTLFLELGQLCALDVALNNFDRVPLPIWQNDGNLGNVMVVGGGAGIVGIDQQVNHIEAGPPREVYLAKVHSLVQQVLPGGDVSDIVAKLREVLAVNCGAELSDAHAGIFIKGLQSGFKAIAEAWETKNLQEGLATAKQVCWDQVHLDDFLNFDMNSRNGEMLEMMAFVETVAETISKSLRSATAEDL